MDDISEKQKNRTKPRIKKTLEQQLASAQMRLNRLQHKSKQETKQIETRQKIILGAEVAKALDCDVFTVDKELVLGMLLETPNLHPDDKVRFREGANKQVISSQADSLIKISRIWA
ncbi:conjugal transfer protein TraD, partial [Klebsiella pneumoniae]|uniref:conjugal transfer protein TraD n=9 Tax=Klebsiella pneumoniae TaxID=573 RepID=UPI001FAF0729